MAEMLCQQLAAFLGAAQCPWGVIICVPLYLPVSGAS